MTSEDKAKPLINIEDIENVDSLYKFLGISEDMKFSAECFEKLAKSLEVEDPDNLLWIERQAFFSAAAIAYSRCFGSGVREKLDTNILDLLPQDKPGAAREVHKFITNMRDKHIAHSVSPFESVMVAGRVDWPEPDNPLVTVGWMTMVGLPIGVELARSCRDLARCIVNHLTDEIRLTQEAIQEALKGESPEEIATRPVMQYQIPGPGDAGIARRFGRGLAP